MTGRRLAYIRDAFDCASPSAPFIDLMAHPLVWPGKYFFYPIGNTPAVCLTRDLAPEESADVVLLGCGDPRHVLYTVFSEPDGCE